MLSFWVINWSQWYFLRAALQVWRAYPGRALHGVGQTRVNDVLLRRSLKPEWSLHTWGGGDSTRVLRVCVYSRRSEPGTQRWGRWGRSRRVCRTSSPNSPGPTLQGDESVTDNKHQSVGGRNPEWMLRLTQQVVVGVSLVFEGESPVTDVVQVLQPLEVGNGHTAGVQVHVLTHERRRERHKHRRLVYFSLRLINLWQRSRAFASTDRDHQDVSLQEDPVSFRCGRPVGSLCDDLKVPQTPGQFTDGNPETVSQDGHFLVLFI